MTQQSNAPGAVLPAQDTMAPVRALSERLVAWPSETGSDGEAAFADRLDGLLRETPYFRDHPDGIVLLDSHGTPPRRNVAALVRGSGPRTLVLAGHFDTVSIANYRDLAPLARDAEALTAALIADLAGRERSGQEERALRDLESGAFVPGRGMLDMKSGIAAGIALLEHHAREPGRTGNLLLLATPDEERNSQGMRAMRAALPELAERWNLDIVGAVNLDSVSDQGDGSEGRAIHRGTIGKLMPFAFVVGEPSHAAYPFDGVSAHLAAAEILRRIEANVDLCDRGAGEVSPPPICLEGRDLRGGYEVTTPERVFLAFNWLFHSWSPETLFARFAAEVETALGEAMRRFEAQAAVYGEIAGRKPKGLARTPRVLRFEELHHRLRDTGDAEALRRWQALCEELRPLDDPLAKTRRLVEAAVEAAGLTGPAVVIGFASLHYPHTHLDPERPEDRDFAEAVEAARLEAETLIGQSLVYRETFLGISDMSFLGHAPAAAEADLVARNTPAPDLTDGPVPGALRFPAINVGPWGRDYHQRLERVHAPYTFRDLPRILDAIRRHVLGPGKAT